MVDARAATTRQSYRGIGPADDRRLEVVFSSHVLGEVEEVADSIAIVEDGAVLSSGPTAELLGGGSLEKFFLNTLRGAAKT